MNVPSISPADALGSFRRTFGSVNGPSAPLPFRALGGPVTGTLIQSGLGAGAGYGMGKFMDWLQDKKTDRAKLFAAGGAMLGPAANMYGLVGLPKPTNLTITPEVQAARDPLYGTAARLAQDPHGGQGAAQGLLGTKPLPHEPYAFDGTKPQAPNIQERLESMKSGAAQRKELYALMTSKLVELQGEKRAYFGQDIYQPGYPIPTGYAEAEIASDPMLDPWEKARALQVVHSAAERQSEGFLTWPNVARAAVGAGVGYAGAALFGKLLSGIYGGLTVGTQRKLREAGVIAGVLKGTGVI